MISPEHEVSFTVFDSIVTTGVLFKFTITETRLDVSRFGIPHEMEEVSLTENLSLEIIEEVE